MAQKTGWIARADTDLDWDTGDATAHVKLEALPGWDIDVEVTGVRDGAPILRAIRLRAPEGQVVTTRALAAVPTGAILRAMGDDLAAVAGGGDQSASPAMSREVRRWVSGLDERSRTGRASNPEAFYAQLAVEYERVARGSPSPTKDLAAKYGVTYTRMKNLLSETVSRGFLIRGAKGRAGGRATDKAKEIL